ncbi:MAG TPA: PAS domain-containing protein, partial [Gemmatimonadaceae bacterium]|nr:PAS domain-containing protein [Gemmatimonadaceae bacterium]
MRTTDWARTPLGEAEDWPQSLRTAVSICLASRFPILVWWGRELVMLYNDAYAPIIGAKHPDALGRPGREVFPEIWEMIGPMLHGVLTRGNATWSEDQMLPLERKGFQEECYFTFSYSPILDESGGIGGVFTAVTETTGRVLSERRLTTLRELGAQPVAHTAEDACRAAAAVLAGDPADLPFALLYLLDDAGTSATLAAATGPTGVERSVGARIALDGDDARAHDPLVAALAAVSATGVVVPVTEPATTLAFRSDDAWRDPPALALALPVAHAGSERPYGVLVAGVSPRLALDGEYRGFFDLVARHIATAIASARAYEEERRRAEALAEIDRAKTRFFSNVSHEFRTPLTLMLGPAEDLLSAPAAPLAPADRERVDVLRRNGLRLLKLVNTLLDFSRIEAGRMQAVYEPIDLGVLTAELASSFQSATDRAGLGLDVDCPPLGEPVYVDVSMWEKIVSNLLSNAFKYTFDGTIRVVLRREGARAVLRVEDTGVGIPPAELPRIFDRFHRVEGTRSRSHEGSGIGLSLVRELVRLHGGEIGAESEPGRGSVFTVTVPMGSAHLPADRVANEARGPLSRIGAAPYVEEALRWLPDASDDATSSLPSAPEMDIDGTPAVLAGASPRAAARVLVVDDNADMRRYLVRLLESRYAVECASDGEEALERARAHPPDVVVTDIMMPRVDGTALIEALRADARTSDIPVIVLSARAGEEAVLDGLEHGADDYLVKPFSARELLARVRTHLELARARAESQQRLTTVVESINDAFLTLDHAWRFTYVNRHAEALLGRARDSLLGRVMWTELDADGAGPLFHPELRRAAEERTMVSYETWEPAVARWLDVRAYPSPDGLAVHVRDITPRRRAEEERRAGAERLNRMLEMSAEGVIETDATGRYIFANAAAERILRLSRERITERTYGTPEWRVLTVDGHPMPPHGLPVPRVLATGRPVYGHEHTIELPTGERVVLTVSAAPLRDSDGNVTGAVATFSDTTERWRTVQERERLIRALERERSRLVEIFRQAPAFIVVLRGPEHRVELANPAYRELVGGRDVEGKTIREALPEIEGQGFFELLDRVYASGEPFIADEARVLLRREGKGELEERFLKFVYLPLEEADGAVSGIFVHGLDVTVQVLARREVEEVYRQAREANEAKAKFLSMMSHELRTPLNAITGFADILMMGIRGPVTEPQREDLRRMRNASQYLLSLINDILNFTKLESGQVEFRLERVPLADALAEAHAMVSLRLQEKHLAYAAECDPALAVRADGERLQQILLN